MLVVTGRTRNGKKKKTAKNTYDPVCIATSTFAARTLQPDIRKDYSVKLSIPRISSPWHAYLVTM
jgi:hypothetical protein